jgi:hypothetical protein
MLGFAKGHSAAQGIIRIFGGLDSERALIMACRIRYVSVPTGQDSGLPEVVS